MQNSEGFGREPEPRAFERGFRADQLVRSSAKRTDYTNRPSIDRYRSPVS